MVRKISDAFTPYNKNKLRVLLCHNIAEKDFATFREKLKWLSKKWNFINVKDFEEMMNGNKKIIGNNLLLTFDDGFLSDYFVAKEILNPMGISALFFIISGYSKLKEKKDQIAFLEKNLYPKWRGHNIPYNRDDLINMSLENIEYLIQTGHEIGFHTTSHQKLSIINNETDLNDEIIKGADELEAALNIKIKHFSFSFGDLDSFSEKALTTAKSRFKYIYTGMRGNNAKHLTHPFAIRRDTIAVTDSNNMVGIYLLGGADFLYYKKFNIYESWIK